MQSIVHQVNDRRSLLDNFDTYYFTYTPTLLAFKLYNNNTNFPFLPFCLPIQELTPA